VNSWPPGDGEEFLESTDLLHRLFTADMQAPVMSAIPFALPRDLSCSGCGYGIVSRARLPERCPMCGGSGWAARPGRQRSLSAGLPSVARRQPLIVVHDPQPAALIASTAAPGAA